MMRLSVRCRAEHSEQVLASLLQLSSSGLEQRDEGETVEYAIYAASSEVPVLPRGPATVAGVEVQVHGEQVPDDWADRWKRFHRPVLVGGKLNVRPPWEKPMRRKGSLARRREGSIARYREGSVARRWKRLLARRRNELIDVVIDPGKAFGTGSHQTTRLCLEMMLSLSPGGALCDLGCGSGVLAIAASKLGWEPVLAVDNDRDALEAAAANAQENSVMINLAYTDLRHDPIPVARTVVANLTTRVLGDVARYWSAATVCPERLIVSGLLRDEEDEVERAFSGFGLALRQCRRMGDWAACLFAAESHIGPPHKA